MIATLQARLIALGILLGGLLATFLWGHHVGARAVQTRWDAAKVAQAKVVAQASAHNAAQALTWIDQFRAIGATYEAASHAHAPTVADSVAAGIAGRSLRLRDAAACPGTVPAATVRSRAADAAATQALADRVQAAIAAVRAGDTADARERQLGAQVTGLQAILRAERAAPIAQ